MDEFGNSQPISFYGFNSASIDRATAEYFIDAYDPKRKDKKSYLFQIQWVQDSGFFFLGNNSSQPEEREFLINDGEQFVVKRIYEGEKKSHTQGFKIKIIELL